MYITSDNVDGKLIQLQTQKQEISNNSLNFTTSNKLQGRKTENESWRFPVEWSKGRDISDHANNTWRASFDGKLLWFN